MNPLPISYLLDNSYEIKGILGRGGFGITYLARDINLEQDVAIKEYAPVDIAHREQDLSVVPASNSQHRDFSWGMDSFLRGARTLARFKDPSIVSVFRFFKSSETKTAYLVMEMIRGTDLVGFSKTVTSPDQIETAFRKLAMALQKVHQAQFQHRDVKPENILVRASSQNPVLIDFDSARQTSADRTVPLVTPYYSALEQYSSDQIQGPFSDIYSLCASFVRVITGAPPPDAPSRILNDTYQNLAEDPSLSIFSAEFLAQIDRGMTLLPDKRPQSVDELLNEKPRGNEQTEIDSPGAESSSAILKNEDLPDAEPSIRPVPSFGAQSKTDFPELTKAATMLTRLWESLVYRFQKLELEYKVLLGAGLIALTTLLAYTPTDQQAAPKPGLVVADRSSATSTDRPDRPRPIASATSTKVDPYKTILWQVTIDGNDWISAGVLGRASRLSKDRSYELTMQADTPFRFKVNDKIGLSSPDGASYGDLSGELYLKNVRKELQSVELTLKERTK